MLDSFFNLLLDFFSQSPTFIFLQLFAIFGYLVFFQLVATLFLHFLAEFRQKKNVSKWKWVVLAMDSPALNVQTPKAVEQFFFHLAGAYSGPNVGEKFWGGYKQKWFSFEIISIEGYIQFLVRTEETFRDLVEAAMYAQYPDAEITEVEDYVTAIPEKFPNPEYDIWGADFSLANDNAFPIRTYREFEHSISKDTVLKDPMGAFLESFSRIGVGEQMWFQILIEPISNSWKEPAINKIKELIGDESSKAGHGGNAFLDSLSSVPMKFLEGVGDQVFSREASAPHEEKKGPPNKLGSMTPGQSKLVEAMEKKISMLGFKTKMRGLYIGRKEVFKPSRGVNALIGSIQQYNIPTANSIVPKFTTGADYFFSKQRSDERKTGMIKAYKKRKIGWGANPCILNVEELATIWHFPMSHVKTPSVQKAQNKNAEPPAGLPVERIFLAPPITDISGEAPHIDGGNFDTDTKFG
jgi:hypothetical protein